MNNINLLAGHMMLWRANPTSTTQPYKFAFKMSSHIVGNVPTKSEIKAIECKTVSHCTEQTSEDFLLTHTQLIAGEFFGSVGRQMCVHFCHNYWSDLILSENINNKSQ